MERIINQKHNKETFLYATSRMFERMGYYGFRALILLYLLSETFNMSRVEAFKIYGWTITLILFSQILGGFLGDLIIGNKRSIIIGGLMQAIGAFILCIPYIYGVYVGFILIGLGTGLYKPNLISQFGKLYLNKTKLLDSGFLILNFFVNIGAFVVTLLIGYIAIEFESYFGFIVIGVFFVLSTVYPFFAKEKTETEQTGVIYSLNHRIILISIIIIFVGLFWTIYEIPTLRILELKLELNEYLGFDFLNNSETSLLTLLLIPISFLLIIFWTYFYYSQILKLIIGFSLAIVSFSILIFMSEIPIENQIYLYILSLVLLGIAETHITPIIYSSITRYINQKYLAIAVGLSTIPARIVYLLLAVFNVEMYNDLEFGLKVSIIIMGVVLLILIGLILIFKKDYLQHSI